MADEDIDWGVLQIRKGVCVMRRVALVFVIVLSTVCSATGVVGAERGPEVDLLTISDTVVDSREECDIPFEPIAWESCENGRRWYVSGIVGASFASLTTAGGPNSDPNWNPAVFSGTVNDTLFTGGGAIGMAIPQPAGALRVEFEARGRDLQDGVEALTVTPRGGGDPFTLPNQVRAADGWSTMANVWRDVRFNNRVGVYLGGGVGAGGYRLSSLAAFDVFGASADSCDSVTAFAWQAGTGIFYNVSDRIALDLGYRFLGISPQNGSLYYDGPYDNGTDIVNVTDQPYGTLTTAFSASEVLLSIRIYEPFRRWH